MSEIPIINQQELLKVYNFGLKTKNNLIIFGNPGIGKSEIAEQCAAQLNLDTLCIDLSIIEAPDLIGLPSVKEGKTIWAAPEFLPYDFSISPKVLILDEIDKVKQELQPALLQLLLKRTINNKPINIGGIILTSNNIEDNSYSQLISHALTNRCMAFQLKADFESWRIWAVAKNINPLIIGFLYSNREQFSKQPKDPLDYAYPSPRSWVLASRDYDVATDLDQNLRIKIIAGHVGESASIKLKLWISLFKEVEIRAKRLIHDGIIPESLREEEKIILSIRAIIILKSLLDDDQIKSQNLDNLFKWMLSLREEYCIAAIKASLNEQYLDSLKLLDNQYFNQIISKIVEAAIHAI